MRAVTIAVSAVMALAACASEPRPWQEGYGPQAAVNLPTAKRSLLPTLKIAEATGWLPGQAPTAAPGLRVTAFAAGLDHPRWLLVLPNGDVLVAETNAPKKEAKGFRAWVMGKVMARAGAATPSANRISLLRDADGDGVAEIKTAFLPGLNSPFGMALVGGELFVANTDALVKYPFVLGQTSISAPAVRVTDLPGGPINHHWTKNVIASPDGSRLYVTVGSNSNVGENGMAAEEGRAAIWQVDVATGQKRLFATGLRNPNGLAFEPVSGQLWTAVNERDEIGDDLVPDYITSVRDGGFYGWPYSYFGGHVDERVKPPRPDLVAGAITPDYPTGAHTATMSVIFQPPGAALGAFASGAFIGQHGSWNRSELNGYKVVFIPFTAGRPSGGPQEVLTGFVADGKARGRPVGVALDMRGGLLVADDVGNVVWRVTGPAAQVATRPPT